MNDQNPPDEWTVFGNTLYLGPQGAPYIAFPGDMATAQQIRDAHNEAMADLRRRAEQAEAGEAARRIAAIDLVNVLTTLRYPDESTLWRFGGKPLEQGYQTLKAALTAEKGGGLIPEIAALLCGVRHYVRQHGILIGECVAWNVLKKLVGIGISSEADDQRWSEYQRQEGTAYANYYRRGAQ